MVYLHVPRYSSEDTKSQEGLLQESDEEQSSAARRARPGRLSRVWTTLAQLQLVLSCIILATTVYVIHLDLRKHAGDVFPSTYTRWDGCPIPDHCPKCPTLDSRKVYQTNFFNDYRYQSLDRQYDYVFDEMLYDGGVWMPNDEHGGQNESAVIGMSVSPCS
jgi:hypothetical protein